MSDTNIVKNWSYPFKPNGGNLNPLQYLTALAKADGGYYPIGKKGQWHGGVHFDAKTAGTLDQTSVRCIADGEVIAYRIDNVYPQSLYQDEQGRSRSAPFSTGFVLVKHRLEAPALPAPPTSTPTATPTAPPSLTFFSLYMHLLDWSSYGKSGAPTPPEFISETLYKVKADKATDPLVGLRVRTAPGSTVVALLPKGTKVKVGVTDTANPKWRKLENILQGRAVPEISGPDLGWVFVEEMEPTSEADVFLVKGDANDSEPSLAPEKGLNVRKTGNGRSNDPKTGLLPLGATFSLEPGTGAYRKLKAVVSGQDISPLSANSVQNIQGFVHYDSLDTTRAEPKLNQVHVLTTPYPIKAGDLIGHVGLYQNHDDGSPQPVLHLEVFSCDDVPGFVSRCRTWAQQLPAQQKTLLKIHKGASKLIPHREGLSATNPPKISDPGTPIGVELILSQSLLDGLPADCKIEVSTLVPGSSTPLVTRWWRLDNLLADASGNPISGWLAEQDPLTTRHSPWEWVGYDFIKETGRPIGKAAYFFDAVRRLTDEERANYRALVSQEDQGPVKARLYDLIDGNRDNKLTANEIRAALQRPWHAQSIAQLITRYESEWFWNEEKWDELDPLMGHIPLIDPNENWVSEKQRIEKLSWRHALANKHGISADGMAWHFQPMGLLNSLDSSADDNDLKWLKVPRGQLTFDVEGNDIENSIYFSRVAHWPPVGNSGITLGRGYDIGQQPNVRADLESVGIADPFLSWIVGGQGKRQAQARDYLAAASADIRKHKITRKQQHLLFVYTYKLIEADVKRISTANATLSKYYPSMVGKGEEAWSAIDERIKDLMIDLRYRGDYKPATREKIQESCYKNDYSSLKQIMQDESFWVSIHNVPADRFNKRKEYTSDW